MIRDMRTSVLILFAALAGNPTSAAAQNGNAYVCDYAGDWGCSLEPGGVCVDGGRRMRSAPRYTLHVDFDTRRIRLNGLDGHLERDRNTGDYWVYWHVAGLGQPKLTLSTHDRFIIIELTLAGPPGYSTIGEFHCRRAR